MEFVQFLIEVNKFFGCVAACVWLTRGLRFTSCTKEKSCNSSHFTLKHYEHALAIISSDLCAFFVAAWFWGGDISPITPANRRRHLR